MSSVLRFSRAISPPAELRSALIPMASSSSSSSLASTLNNLTLQSDAELLKSAATAVSERIASSPGSEGYKQDQLQIERMQGTSGGLDELDRETLVDIINGV